MTNSMRNCAAWIGASALVVAAMPVHAIGLPHGAGTAAPATHPAANAIKPPPKPPKGGGGMKRPSGGKGDHGGGHSRPRPPARGSANVTINHNYGGHDDHYRHHDRHDHWDDWDDHWHPLETAAKVAVTAAVVGSIVRSIPPNCSTIMVNGISYSQCGSTWYQPQYVGSSVQYVVVNPPR